LLFWIDTHAHLAGGVGQGPADRATVDQGAALALQTMPQFGVSRSLVMAQPAAVESADELGPVKDVAARSPQSFAFLAGGTSLNPLIQQAMAAGTVTPALLATFRERARAIVEAGASGFGETTALHLSFSPEHPFEQAPPDHPLFLELADIAGQAGLPIDFHMEAVARAQAVHQRFRTLSSRNPTSLQENIAAFERLLAHNRQAKIVWAHVGWDNTGDMTTTLLRRLLAAHPNLYLQLKIDNPPATFPQNRVLDPADRLKADWLALMRDYPDRFVLGPQDRDRERRCPVPARTMRSSAGRDSVPGRREGEDPRKATQPARSLPRRRPCPGKRRRPTGRLQRRPASAVLASSARTFLRSAPPPRRRHGAAHWPPRSGR
jgi:hypothetical protein